MDNQTVITIKENELKDGVPIIKDRKVVKFFKALKEGKNQSQASLEAGYSDNKHTTRVMQSKAFKEIDKFYSSVLLRNISMQDIAEVHKRNILQTVNIPASVMSIKLALEELSKTYGNENPDDDVTIITLKN